MKKTLWLAIALTIASVIPAKAQLAGTQRLNENYWFTGDRCVKFGNYPNASICYTGGNLVIDILNGGGKVVFPDGLDLGAGNQTLGSSLTFEGATADAFETLLTVVDPTADRTVTIPNASGALILSAGGVADSANAVWGGTGTLIFEGATADAFEGTLSPADVTADRTWSLPDASGKIALGGNFTVITGANTACDTTCGASNRCIVGQDAGASNGFVGCASALADSCLCLNNN